MFVDGCQRLETKVLGDLLETRSVAAVQDVVLDEGEDLLLATGEGHGSSTETSGDPENTPKETYPKDPRRARLLPGEFGGSEWP